MNMKKFERLEAHYRQSIRNHFGVWTNVPVIVDKGESYPPILVGGYGGYYTRGGRPIYHPTAYSKKGWSNMVYQCSTLKIYVGEHYGR